MGFDQAALEDAARQGFADGAFEESEEEGAELVEEFFPLEEGGQTPNSSAEAGKKVPLQAKLGQKAALLNAA